MVMAIILGITLFGCSKSEAQSDTSSTHVEGTLPMLPTGYQSPRYHGLPQPLKGSQELEELFKSTQGDYLTILETKIVPPAIFKNLPTDFKVLPIKEKTGNFISLILPHILEVNEDVLRVQDSLIALKTRLDSGQKISLQEQDWLDTLTALMQFKTVDIQKLITQIDVMPVALVLAQAINESGWGTSRFAQEGNALFGQHASRDGKLKHIVSKSGTAKVAAFDDLYLCTAGYVFNINRNGAYTQLRAIRTYLKQKGKPVTGTALAAGLVHYSERGEAYVDELRAIIRRYKLEELNDALLHVGGQLNYYQFIR